MTAHCATCNCADDAPRQPTSDDRRRAVLIAGVKAVIDSNKRARSTDRDRSTQA